ncbi:MAG: DNA polymerase IV [Chloroflexi bacterium]|nr:DNA polymerase IV [Chloroflexota bacterium]
MGAILHCDLDAFYASVEQILNPDLVGKPVIVGGDPGQRRGVVAAASYEARAFGVHSAMPMATAVRLCPHGVYIRPQFGVYTDYSQRVFDVYHSHTPLVEPMSLDEAFLDLSGTQLAQGATRDVALRIRQEVKTETGLDLSIGIATSKVVAKIASDLEKPRGFVEVPDGEEAAFLEPLPLRRLPGLGPSTEERLKSLRLETIGDVAALPIEELLRRLGKWGFQLWEFAHGIDNRPVVPPGEPKSISRESTFDHDLDDQWQLESILRQLAAHATKNMRDHGLRCRTVHLKLRYDNFETISRSHSLPAPCEIEDTLVHEIVELFRAAWDRTRKIRLLGAGLSNFTAERQQLGLFDQAEHESPPKQAAITATLDNIRDRYGWKALTVGPGRDIQQRDWRRDDLPGAQ